MNQLQNNTYLKRLGTWDIFVAGVALVVAASTMVSEFTGYFQTGIFFAVSLLLGFAINLSLAFSAADLSMAFPKAGALYDYARAILPSRWGRQSAAFLGLTFFGMAAFAVSGETAAGAYGLQALLNSDLPLGGLIVLCSILAVIPNVLGVKTTAWVSTGLLGAMLGIRWFFGLAGFLGWGAAGAWSWANLIPSETVSWFSTEGIVTSGLALAIWSFVGIEFACSLAEEVKEPKRSLPRGLVLGLVVVLATSFIMGLGITGIRPLSAWQEIAASQIGAGGDAPQLAVGYTMFGTLGYRLMALASLAATLGSLTILYAAMPRLLQRLAADGYLGEFGSRCLAANHPRTGTPVRATLVSLVIFLIPALNSHNVIDWVYCAAYVWLLLYLAYHVLVLIRYYRNRDSSTGLPHRGALANALVGIVLTSVGIVLSFWGGHRAYGGRALIVLLIAAAFTLFSQRNTLRRKQSFCTNTPIAEATY
ncbi:MAG: APC family permease [Planctomycetes bacterium]|nr:APC family permease [Planctomycetota bacterium]